MEENSYFSLIIFNNAAAISTVSILDDVIFIKNGQVFLTSSVDQIRQEKGMSVDALFREEFRC